MMFFIAYFNRAEGYQVEHEATSEEAMLDLVNKALAQGIELGSIRVIQGRRLTLVGKTRIATAEIQR